MNDPIQPEKSSATTGVVVAISVIGFLTGGLILAGVFLMFSYFRNAQVVDITLPSAEDVEPQNSETPLFIRVDGNGALFVDDEPLTREDLVERLEALGKTDPDQSIVLEGAPTTDFQNIIAILDEAKKAGIWNVSFARSETEQTK